MVRWGVAAVLCIAAGGAWGQGSRGWPENSGDLSSILSGRTTPRSPQKAEQTAFPIYDAEGDCRKAFKGASLATCIREDQFAYDLSRYLWEEVPERARKRCSDMQKPPQMKYTLLQACLSGEASLEQRRRDASAPPAFRY